MLMQRDEMSCHSFQPASRRTFPNVAFILPHPPPSHQARKRPAPFLFLFRLFPTVEFCRTVAGAIFEMVWLFPGGPRFVAAIDKRHIGGFLCASHTWPGRSRALPCGYSIFVNRSGSRTSGRWCLASFPLSTGVGWNGIVGIFGKCRLSLRAVGASQSVCFSLPLPPGFGEGRASSRPLVKGLLGATCPLSICGPDEAGPSRREESGSWGWIVPGRFKKNEAGQ